MPETQDNEAEITLGLLNAVEENSRVTQRSLAGELGIALGLTNAYLKRCVRKGWIKVRMVPANRYAYYLTPTGFAEKSSLTAEFLASSFNFFRRARSQCSALYEQAGASGWRRIALAGSGDLAEIAVLCAASYTVELVGIVDEDAAEKTFAGLPVAASPAALGGVDAVVITDMRNPQTVYDRFVETMPQERVLTMKLLNISRVRPELAE